MASCNPTAPARGGRLAAGYWLWAAWALACFGLVAAAWRAGEAKGWGAWAQWAAGFPLLVWGAARAWRAGAYSKSFVGGLKSGADRRSAPQLRRPCGADLRSAPEWDQSLDEYPHHGRAAARASLRSLVAAGLVCRALLLPFAPPQSDDLYRYIWEGRGQLAGFNPYAHAPDSPELAHLRDGVWARVNHKEYAAIYPPLAQVVFAALAGVGRAVSASGRGDVWVFKLFFTACDLAAWSALAAWLRRRGLPPELSLAWGLNPLVIAEFAGSGHLDSLMILTLIMALAEADRARARAGLAWLSAATAVKLLPAAAAPFFNWIAPPRPPRLSADTAPGRIAGRVGFFARAALPALAPALALGAGYLIYAGAGPAALTRSLWIYQRDWISNAPAFEWMRETIFADDGFMARRWLYAALVGLGLALWATRVSPALGVWALLGAYFTLGPVAHPWYLTLFAALACGRRGAWPWIWLTCAAPLAYAAESAPCGAPLIRLLIWGPFFLGMGAVGAEFAIRGLTRARY